jgi:tetratricopeptide (TPR) repeat protein
MQRYGVAMLADLQGDLGNAIRQYAPMRRDAQRDGNAYWDAMSLWKIADVLRRQGELARAASMAKEAMRAYEALSNSDMAASVAFTIGYCHIHMGQAEDARARFAGLAARFAHGIDKTTVRMARIGERFAMLALLAAQDDPCFDALLPLIEPDPGLPGLSLRYELLDALFVAEALRLNGRAMAACDRYAAIERRAVQYDHRLERAHAVLGMAESARGLGRCDHELARQALADYERIGAAWGRVHACITLALLAPDQAMPHLREASRIALTAGMQDELRLIDRLMQGQRTSVPHPLVFA